MARTALLERLRPVELACPEARLDLALLVADRDPQHVAERVGRSGRQKQHAPPPPGDREGRRGRRGGLPPPTLPTEEDQASSLWSELVEPCGSAARPLDRLRRHSWRRPADAGGLRREEAPHRGEILEAARFVALLGDGLDGQLPVPRGLQGAGLP